MTLFGTEVGIKGASMDARVPEKVRHARSIIDRLGLKTEIEVDGGIRRQSVLLIHSAGADWIVPGSLMFGEEPRRVLLKGAAERVTEIRAHPYWRRTTLDLGNR